MTKNGAWKSGNIAACLKECANRDKLCNMCLSFSEYKKHPLTYCSEHGKVRCSCVEKFKELKNV